MFLFEKDDEDILCITSTLSRVSLYVSDFRHPNLTYFYGAIVF